MHLHPRISVFQIANHCHVNKFYSVTFPMAIHHWNRLVCLLVCPLVTKITPNRGANWLSARSTRRGVNKELLVMWFTCQTRKMVSIFWSTRFDCFTLGRIWENHWDCSNCRCFVWLVLPIVAIIVPLSSIQGNISLPVLLQTACLWIQESAYESL